MEDKQKVYIKGNIERGDEVIKYLEDLGGAILDKHDKMIRQEIDCEIAALNKEIK